MYFPVSRNPDPEGFLVLIILSFSLSQCSIGIGLVGTMEAIKSMDPSEEIVIGLFRLQGSLKQKNDDDVKEWKQNVIVLIKPETK